MQSCLNSSNQNLKEESAEMIINKKYCKHKTDI